MEMEPADVESVGFKKSRRFFGCGSIVYCLSKDHTVTDSGTEPSNLQQSNETMTEIVNSDLLRIGLAQIAPVWLKRNDTVAKVCQWIQQAADQNCQLVAFGETLIPGYPFWLEYTGGAKFNNDFQKDMFAHYIDQAVVIEAGHLDEVCQVARKCEIMVMVGCYERAVDRGGHTGYASLVTISAEGQIVNVHRKAMPTYEERLVWGTGDGHGLQTFPLGKFTTGGLNCWENWMPLMRAALYGLGEDLHISVWPGGIHNTKDNPILCAKEGRSYVGAVCGILRNSDIPDDIPHAETLKQQCPEIMATGGSAIAGPDGTWVCEPADGEEQLIVAEIDHRQVRRERHNFDPAGHYSRPDITQLVINRERRATIRIHDAESK